MKIDLLIYGALTEATKKNRLEVENIKDTESLKARMFQSYPLLKKYKFSVAVNESLVTQNTVLSDGNIVAFLPPFAGG